MKLYFKPSLLLSDPFPCSSSSNQIKLPNQEWKIKREEEENSVKVSICFFGSFAVLWKIFLFHQGGEDWINNKSNMRNLHQVLQLNLILYWFFFSFFFCVFCGKLKSENREVPSNGYSRFIPSSIHPLHCLFFNLNLMVFSLCCVFFMAGYKQFLTCLRSHKYYFWFKFNFPPFLFCFNERRWKRKLDFRLLFW